MPPSARGGPRGSRGRRASTPTNRSAVNLLVQTTANISDQEDGRREQIEQEVAKLLAQTGLHKGETPPEPGTTDSLEATVNSAEDAKELDELEKRLIPPKLRYPQPVENLVEQISKDVEWAAEVTVITSKHNALRPQKVLDHIRVSPVEKWAAIDTLWKDLWHKRSTYGSESDLLYRVFDAFEEDLSDLKHGLKRTLGKVDRTSAHLDSSAWGAATTVKAEIVEDENLHGSKRRRIDPKQPNPQWLIDYLETNATAINEKTREPFWNVIDPDDEIYTDSEEEENQTVLRHAPFIRPLRRVVRELRRKEQLYTICGRSLRVFDETQNMQEIVKDNVEVVDTVFYDAEEKLKRQKRQKWREWVDAARYARWRTSAIPSIPLRYLQQNSNSSPVSPELLKSLEDFKIISRSGHIPSSRIGRAFLRHFALHLPHRLDSAGLSEQNKNFIWPQMNNPFDWMIPDCKEITQPRKQDILNSDDHEVMKVKMGAPGFRFYVGTLN